MRKILFYYQKSPPLKLTRSLSVFYVKKLKHRKGAIENILIKNSQKQHRYRSYQSIWDNLQTFRKTRL